MSAPQQNGTNSKSSLPALHGVKIKTRKVCSPDMICLSLMRPSCTLSFLFHFSFIGPAKSTGEIRANRYLLLYVFHSDAFIISRQFKHFLFLQSLEIAF